MSTTPSQICLRLDPARPVRAPRPLALSLLALATGALVLLVAPTGARAQGDGDAASCSFYDIEASNQGQGIDPKLAMLEKKFSRPPLSAWTKFALLRHEDKTIELSRNAVLETASKRRLEVVYEEYSKKAKKERFKLRLTFKRPNNKVIMTTSVTVDAGDYLVIATTSGQEASNFLAITCKK